MPKDLKLISNSPIMEFENAKLTHSLSAAVIADDHLWVASDESTSVESLRTDDGLTFRHHQSFPLADLIRLPAHGTQFDQEIDIEGMDFEEPYLWIIGSHSIKRKKIEKNDPASTEKKIRKIAKTEAKGNRFILARIPLVTDSVAETQRLARINADQTLKVAQIDCDLDTNDLIEAIKRAEQNEGDLHLAKFLSVPGKDNGFDIEGLAVADDRVFLGLRGPVLHGWAMILELCVEFNEPSRLVLKNIGPGNREYKKHFIELNGLGIRDLCIDGNDILILAGPTMNLDGPIAVFRWENALISTEAGETCVFSGEVRPVRGIPNGMGNDHAEGMTLVPASASPQKVLIVYDSPADERLEDTNAVRADVFELSGV
jgi:hypothetical protein